jgi:hypothetical protein
MEESFCGCCGREVSDERAIWCADCEPHVGGFRREPWAQTYSAQYGVPCPYDPIPVELPTLREVLDGQRITVERDEDDELVLRASNGFLVILVDPGAVIVHPERH